MSYKLSIEQYDQQLGNLAQIGEAVAYDIFDYVKGSVEPQPSDTIVSAVNIFEISATTTRAYRSLQGVTPGAYLTVYSSPASLQKMMTDEPDMRLVFAGNMPPENHENWRKFNTIRALAAGCVGAVVDFDCTDLGQEFPAALFFRRQS